MIISVFRRRLKDGRTFEEFKTGWEADKGFGVPARVFSAVSLEDPQEVLTVGFVAVEPEDIAAGLERTANQETVRHDRIDGVIETTELKAMYAVASEHDFTDVPREVAWAKPPSCHHMWRLLPRNGDRTVNWTLNAETRLARERRAPGRRP